MSSVASSLRRLGPAIAAAVIVSTARAEEVPVTQSVIVSQSNLSTVTADPNTWPGFFTEANNPVLPYRWVEGASAIASDPFLASAVTGGQEGALRLVVCRAQLQDGVHIGKAFSGVCAIGWGGREVVLNTGYQILVNTRTDLAAFLPQQWVPPATMQGTFIGGAAGGTSMRVCSATHTNGSQHPGKEWAGRCNYGWGGQEFAGATYAVLRLPFDKANWQNAQVTEVYTFGSAATTTAQPFDTTASQGVSVLNFTVDPARIVQGVHVFVTGHGFLSSAGNPVSGPVPEGTAVAIGQLAAQPAFTMPESQLDEATLQLLLRYSLNWELLSSIIKYEPDAPRAFQKIPFPGRPDRFRLQLVGTGSCVDVALSRALVLNACRDLPTQAWFEFEGRLVNEGFRGTDGLGVPHSDFESHPLANYHCLKVLGGLPNVAWCADGPTQVGISNRNFYLP
jgi:hypothetical protein